MSSIYKKKLLEEVNDIPEDFLPKLFRIIHFLKNELIVSPVKDKKRGSLKGIWKGSKIDDSLLIAAKKSLFSYEYK